LQMTFSGERFVNQAATAAWLVVAKPLVQAREVRWPRAFRCLERWSD
jgi:hypothetical protein